MPASLVCVRFFFIFCAHVWAKHERPKMKLINFSLVPCIFFPLGLSFPSIRGNTGAIKPMCMRSGCAFRVLIHPQSLLRLQLLTHYKCEYDHLFTFVPCNQIIYFNGQAMALKYRCRAQANCSLASFAAIVGSAKLKIAFHFLCSTHGEKINRF